MEDDPFNHRETKLHIYRMEEMNRIAAIDLKEYISGLAITNNGNLLAGGGERIYIWEVGTGKKITEFPDKPTGKWQAYTKLSFSPNGDLLVAVREKVAEITNKAGEDTVRDKNRVKDFRMEGEDSSKGISTCQF